MKNRSKKFHQLTLVMLLTLSTVFAIEFPETIKQSFQASSVSEGGGLSTTGSKQERENLIQYIKDNRLLILDKLNQLGFNQMQKSVFLLINETLSAEEYVDFIDSILTLYENKQLDLKFVSQSLQPIGRKIYFFDVNNENDQIIALMNRAKSLLHQEPDAIDCINRVLRGSIKSSVPMYVDSMKLQKPEKLNSHSPFRNKNIREITQNSLDSVSTHHAKVIVIAFLLLSAYVIYHKAIKS